MTIETPAAPVVGAPSKNPFERLAGVLFSPGETFADIARRPDFIVPMVLFILLGYASSFLMTPRMDWDAVAEQQRAAAKKQRPNMSEADLERGARIGMAIVKVTMYIAPLLGVVWQLIMALVLMGAVRLMGGEGTFKQAFSATLYAQVPLVIFSILVTIVVVARGTVDPMTMATVVKSNPAFLVDIKEQPVLFSLLASIDLFTIWTVVLLIFGFSALSRLSWAKTATIIGSLFVVMTLIRLAIAAMNS